MHVMNTPQTTAGLRSSCHASPMCTQPWQGLGHDRDHWSVNSCWGRPLLGRWIGGVAPCCRSSPPCCKSGLALRGLHWQWQMHQIQSGTVPVCPLHSEDGALHGGEEGGEGEGGLGMEEREEREKWVRVVYCVSGNFGLHMYIGRLCCNVRTPL